MKNNDIKNKILSGLELTFKKLVNSKSKNDGYLIYSKDGKIIKVRARDLKK